MKKLFLVFLFFMISACHQAEEKHVTQTMVIKKEPLVSSYYYTGTIQPIKTTVVTSPAEGVVQDMAFHYGDQIKENQPLFTIYSDKFQADYKNALMQYIKSKTEFNNAKAQLNEADFLYKNELISSDDYKAKQTGFYTAQLTLLQSQDVLSGMLKQLDIKGFNPYDLTIKDIDKITHAFHSQTGFQKLFVSSPTKGVILLPTKNDSNDVRKIAKGESVKQGDLLALVGDVSGLIIHINVNEFNINQLKVGQKVNVTGTAFSEMHLQGEIASVDRQGQMGQGGVPIFPAEIIVSKLTPLQQEVIHIGMSAKVEIMIESDPVIAVPLAAVFEKNGKPYIKVEKNHLIQDVLVRTKQTTDTSVVIEANVQDGDHVVFTG